MGPVRLFLALLVMLHHVIHLPLTGVHAVHVFYLMSGYLMTHVVAETYGTTHKGFLIFWFNRALRLFPGYWLSLLIGFGVLWLVGDSFARGMQDKVYMPATAAEWLQNAVMVYPSFWPNEVVPRIAPQSWAICVELVFYAVISLGAAQTKRRVLIWLALSMAYIAYWTLGGYHTKAWSYFSIGAGSLPFAVGALLYHERGAVLAAIHGRERQWLGAGFALFWGFIALRWGMNKTGLNALAHVVLPLNVVPAAIITAAVMAPANVFISPRIDRLAGDLSYPIYISHFTFGMLSIWLLGYENTELGARGFAALPLCFAMTLAFSLAVVFWVDRPLNRLRHRVRATATGSQTDTSYGAASA